MRHKVVSGAVWATVDKFGSMLIQFAVNLVLARLLIPKDFGIIGMLTIFIAVSQTMVDAGFGSALIQKKNPTQIDFSTIFYWNVGLSIFLYIILYISAPFVARYFDMPLLKDVLRLISLSIIINGMVAIQRTKLQKELSFRILAIVNLSSYIFGAICAVTFAKYGLGVWSLVGMQLIYGCCNIILLLLITRWIPSAVFSYSSMKDLFGFGGFIMAANILQTICLNIQGIIIGKRFSATQMGYYSQAYKLDQVTSFSLPQVIVQVMYPVYSSLQDDLDRLNNIVLMNIRVISFVIFPILSILIIIAYPLIEFLYGAKWLPSVPYFRIFCVGGYFVCLQNLNYYAVAAVGKSKELFRWSFYKWGFLLTSLLIGMQFGMYGILWGMVISSANIFIVNAFLAQKHTHLSVNNQFRAILPIFIIALVAILASFYFEYWIKNPYVSVMCFFTIYLSASYIFKIKAINDFKILFSKILQHEV